MKTKTGMIISATIALCLALAAIFGGGCGGDDSPNPPCDDSQAECQPAPDAGGPMTADADSLAPDADTTPDANLDPCAEYLWMSERPWFCDGVTNFLCELEILPVEDVCGIRCYGHFWLSPEQMTISREPPPPSLTFGDGVVVCYQEP